MDNNNTIAFVIAATLILVFLVPYLRKQKKIEKDARLAAEKGKLYSHGPQAQHPHIDNNYCIGCATCTSVCPEGDVLAMIGGKAVIAHGQQCIGHGLCAGACPRAHLTRFMAR